MSRRLKILRILGFLGTSFPLIWLILALLSEELPYERVGTFTILFLGTVAVSSMCHLAHAKFLSGRPFRDYLAGVAILHGILMLPGTALTLALLARKQAYDLGGRSLDPLVSVVSYTLLIAVILILLIGVPGLFRSSYFDTAESTRSWSWCLRAILMTGGFFWMGGAWFLGFLFLPP